jgi:hypothetical protein
MALEEEAHLGERVEQRQPESAHGRGQLTVKEKRPAGRPAGR